MSHLPTRWQRLSRRIQTNGVQSLPGWAWHWLYWNAWVRRFPRGAHARTPLTVASPVSRVAPPICTDIRSWCAAHPDATYLVLNPPRLVTRNLPRSLEPQLVDALAPDARVQIPEEALISIPRARLVGVSGLPVLPDGAYVGQVHANGAETMQTLLSRDPGYYSPPSAPSSFRPGSYYWAMNIWPHNYFHWMKWIVMRLYQVRPLLPPDVKFIVPAALRPFQRDSLHAVGIEDGQMVPFDGSEIWELEHLCFSVPMRKAPYDTPDYIEPPRDQIIRALGIHSPPRRRIYISRRDSGTRRVVNEAELEALLARFDFQPYYLEHMPWRDQVELFAGAEAVVATHGAGLLNLAFAPRGTRALEIFEEFKPGSWHWGLCEALGLEFWCMRGQNVLNPESDVPDLYVPLAQLDQTLHAMLAEHRATPVRDVEC